MLHPNCWSACTISVTWLQCAVHRVVLYRCVASPALHVLLIGQSQKHCVVTQFRVYCMVAEALCFKKERRHYYTEIKTFHNVKLKSISIVQLTHKTIVYQNPKKISSISKHPIEETTADKYIPSEVPLSVHFKSITILTDQRRGFRKIFLTKQKNLLCKKRSTTRTALSNKVRNVKFQTESKGIHIQCLRKRRVGLRAFFALGKSNLVAKYIRAVHIKAF